MKYAVLMCILAGVAAFSFCVVTDGMTLQDAIGGGVGAAAVGGALAAFFKSIDV